MKRKRLTAALLVLAAILSLTACRGKDAGPKTGTEPGEGAGVQSVLTDDGGTRWLTHIYKSDEMEIPEGWTFSAPGGVEYRADRDEFRGVLTRSEEIEDENGGFKRVFDREVAVWDGQGALKSELPLRDPEHRWRSAGSSCFSGDILYSMLWEYDGDAYIGAWDIPSGEIAAEISVLEIQNWDPLLYVRHLAADGEGNLYAGNGKTVTVLSSSLVFVNALKANTIDMKAGPDGRIWAVCPDMAGRGLFRLDPVTGTKEKLTYLDADASQLAFIPSVGSETGGGLDVAASTGAGICRFTPADGGKWASEELMSFPNSGIAYNSDVDMKADSERMAAAADWDRFVFIRNERAENGEPRIVPLLYRKAADLDLTALRTVTLAHAEALPDNIRFQITRFNREHDDIRVTTLDYTEFNNDMNPLGGPFRLTTDLLNGLIRPDLVFGDLAFDPVQTLMRKNAAVDLGTYLDSDPELNRETVAGCVLRAFGDGKGGIWGLSPFFRLRTVTGLPSVLGEYADGWDLDGFLDFAASLPEGTVLSRQACSEARGGIEVDFGMFVSEAENRCSFDSPAFIRYLGWLKDLPTAAELQKRSPAVGIYPEYKAREYYAGGSVALAEVTADECGALLSLSELWGETPAVPGFPASQEDGGSGTAVETEGIFVIPSSSPDPGAAWAFLRSVLLSSDLADTLRWNPNGMTAYLPALEKECGDFLGAKKVLRPNELPSRFDAGSDDAYIEDFMKAVFPGEPYTVVPFCTEQDVKAALKLVRTAGRPFREELPYEARAIVNEEISSYLGGVGSARDCAEKIQSRVSIWLAEHQ